MTDLETLRQAVLEQMSLVIDPETGVDVVRMGLIEDLKVEGGGHVSYIFRPSSPLCPIAVPLSNSIQTAVARVPGVTSQDVKVVDFVLSVELTAWLKQTLESVQSKQEKK